MRPRTVRLSEDLDQIIEAEARERGLTPGEVIREVLSVHYRIRDGETSLEAVVKRIVDEYLEERTHNAAQRIPERTRRAPQRTRDRKPQMPPLLDDPTRKAELIRLHSVGLGPTAIGEKMGYDKSVVSRAIAKLKEEGELVG